MSLGKAESSTSVSEDLPRDWSDPRKRVIACLGIAWAIFQIYATSDIPFFLSEIFGRNVVLTSQEARQIHLAFALSLATVAFPWTANGIGRQFSLNSVDAVLFLLGPIACLYLLFFKDAIATRAGLPTETDLAVSVIGLLCLAIAVYRTIGLPLLIVAALFLSYVFFGASDILPQVMQWKGASFGKAMWHFWMQTEGVFGVALGVSTSMIFLFVLFGALLEKAGAGKFFITLAFSLLGHHRGGPAKAAVVASALSGIYSGSSIANVVTTGTFTIPLMKKTGFSAEKAGAIEVASSTNGQLMPPVMGAAAFLIAEFTGVPYTELLIHALLPATISYIALYYIVHLEALKLGLQGLSKPNGSGLSVRKSMLLVAALLTAAAVGFFLDIGFEFARQTVPALSIGIAAILFAISYLFCLRIAAGSESVDVFELADEGKPLPHFSKVIVTGLHFILPVFILIWCVLVERLSPSYSAFWATLAISFICLTQRTLLNLFARSGCPTDDCKAGIKDVLDGMVAGSMSMVPIAVATGIAGIIIGTVSLTGAHQMVGDLVEFLSGGNLFMMLILVALMCLILGMGLPTTANYIVVSSLMAPVIVSVGMEAGLVVPLVAVHLFVFYFGILADDTPPVGLAAYAAAAISKGDPIRTGVQGFSYDMRTALLPFLFIYNTELLLMDVSFARGVLVFITSTIAMMLFAAAVQGFLLVRNKRWETAILLVLALMLFRPGLVWSIVEPRFDLIPGSEISKFLSDKDGPGVNLVVTGPDFMTGEVRQITINRSLSKSPTDKSVFESEGFSVRIEGATAIVEEKFGGVPDRALRDFDFYGQTSVELKHIRIEKTRPGKDLIYLIALAGVILIFCMQKSRRGNVQEYHITTDSTSRGPVP